MKGASSWNQKPEGKQKEEGTVCSRDDEPNIHYLQGNCRGASKFTFSQTNYIRFHDNKIYSLLQRMSPKRRIKCGCVKSNCQAKYCECYRAGETCGQDCGCVGCKNRRIRRSGHSSKEVHLSCNCVKSGCLKKYCECFQNGRKCGSQCGCCDCKNVEEKA